MSRPEPASGLHSAEFFVPTRDLWWNHDYLGLLAQRWQLQNVRSALDVGCGVGHWTRTLGAHLSRESRIVGIDPEPQWLAAAEQSSANDPRMSFQRGRADALPFPDGEFDLVTCQTVLIHVKDPQAALREMLRVVRPGGQLVLVEPNNSMGSLSLGSALRTSPLEDVLSLVRLYETCQRGKLALGEGWNSIGEELPGLLAQLGAKNIRVSIRDTANALWPPYEDPQQKPWADELRDNSARGYWGWGLDATLRLFLAGEGTEQEFEHLWAVALRNQAETVRALDEGRYVAGHGSVCYVISAERP